MFYVGISVEVLRLNANYSEVDIRVGDIVYKIPRMEKVEDHIAEKYGLLKYSNRPILHDRFVIHYEGIKEFMIFPYDPDRFDEKEGLLFLHGGYRIRPLPMQIFTKLGD